MTRLKRFLLLPALLLPLAAHARVPLEMPDKIALPQFTDTQKLGDAIVTALTNRKWLVEKDTGESITAHLDVRRHRLVLRIDYTPREISFHYVDSAELGYELEDGKPVIHPKANLWLRAVADEVQLQVQPFAFARDPAIVVPVTPPPDGAPAAQAPAAAAPVVAAPPPPSGGAVSQSNQ